MKQDRILQQLDKMVSSGRVTEVEARRLRATQGSAEFEAAIREIRVRHATERLDEAVADNRMSQAEADGHVQNLRDGGHPKGLRARLRMHKGPTTGEGNTL